MVFGQASHGLISGRVIDQQGSSIPGATVTVTSQHTAARQVTRTDTSGYFVFPEVLPGTYTLAVEKEGFQKFEQTGIAVVAADRIDAGSLQLRLGSTKAVVTVSAERNPRADYQFGPIGGRNRFPDGRAPFHWTGLHGPRSDAAWLDILG